MYVFTLRYKLGVDFYANITPLPRGFNVREGERERDLKRQRLRENLFIHVSFIPHNELNSYKRGRYMGLQAPLAIHTNQVTHTSS